MQAPFCVRSQGLYHSSDRIDLKKLRKLIVDGRLVPCYPGLEDNAASCDEVGCQWVMSVLASCLELTGR